MFWQKPLKNSLKSFFVFCFISAALAILASCGRTKTPIGYIARVNDNYLTEETFRQSVDSAHLTQQSQIEFAQNWTRGQLLFAEAEKQGILKDEKFSALAEQNRRELAASFLYAKLFKEKIFTCLPEEVTTYYNNHRTSFVLREEGFIYDAVYFSSESTAEKFRVLAQQSGWQKAADEFSLSTDVTRINRNIFRYNYQTNSAMQARLLSVMSRDEISLVFSDDTRTFWVVHIIAALHEGDIAPIEAVSSTIEARIIDGKKKDFLAGYIKQLYTSNKVELTFQ